MAKQYEHYVAEAKRKCAYESNTIQSIAATVLETKDRTSDLETEVAALREIVADQNEAIQALKPHATTTNPNTVV